MNWLQREKKLLITENKRRNENDRKSFSKTKQKKYDCCNFYASLYACVYINAFICRLTSLVGNNPMIFMTSWNLWTQPLTPNNFISIALTHILFFIWFAFQLTLVSVVEMDCHSCSVFCIVLFFQLENVISFILLFCWMLERVHNKILCHHVVHCVNIFRILCNDIQCLYFVFSSCKQPIPLSELISHLGCMWCLYVNTYQSVKTPIGVI